MIQKIKKPISILLTVLMVFSVFAVVPFAASAAVGDTVSENEYLTFTALENGSSVTLNVKTGDLQYYTNNTGWASYTGTQIMLNEGDFVRFRGKDTTFDYSNHVSIGGQVACSGNVMSLRLDDNDRVQGLSDRCFYYMFGDCTGLTSAPELPETTLAPHCYDRMFYYCTSLTAAPALPATTLAEYCYNSMFNGCISLTTAPALPATMLASNCYICMFLGCENLTTAPALPATMLANNCYDSMFYDCTSLTAAPALPATTLAEYCYNSMFSGCISLTTAPALPATMLASNCYICMFLGCESLTTAPALPATMLANNCYDSMFYGCISLTTAPALPATTLAEYCYSSMFKGCSSIKLSTEQTAEYSIPYSVPSGGNGTTATDALKDMFAGTGGTFTGTPEINKTYYRPAEKYTITWNNEDGSLINTTEVEEGVVPIHADATKEADEQNTYTFTGWDPTPVAATGNATYTATFTATPYVASVTNGGTVTYYSSLKEAIGAAPNGSTVTLHKDVTEEQTAYANNNNTYGGNGNVISGKTITITSNGTGSDRKTVTGSRFDVINGGNVTFTNIIIDGGVADSAHKIIYNNNSWSYYFMVVSYGSTLTFDTGATVQNYYANAHGVIDVGNGRRGSLDPSNGSSTINIKDGSEFKNLGANYGVFREDYKSAINMSGGSVTNCVSFGDEGVFAYVAQGSVFNMTGGKITGCSPEGTAPGLIFLHDGQANGNNKFTMTGGTISGNTAKLGGAVYSHNVNNTITVGGSAVATGNTGTNINNGQSGSSNFYLAAGQTMTIESNNHLSGDSLIGIYSATAPTDSADVKIATGAVKEDIKHIHSDLPGNAGIIYCDGEKDWIWYNNQFVEVSCHHTSHQSGTVWLSTAVNTYEVTFDTDGGTPATIPAQTVVSNSKATKPADPTKDSYMFDGWYNGDTEFNFDTPITANTNLKAKWSVPVASVTTSNGTTTNYTDFGTAVSKWTDGSKLTLLADVTMNGTITVSGTRTLDLNGYGITKSDQGRLFNIDGNLTINDSNPTRSTHKYTVDGTGLAVLDDNGTQSFQGGYITGGHGYTTSGEYGWGGFAIVDLGHKNQNYSLTINGGTIIGNKTDLGGGGVVRVNSNGIFTMNGGAIIYNTTATDPTSPNNDGAVSGEPNVQFYIRGGTIAHNTTKGGVTSDLYLANNQKVIVDEELDSATSIGIKMQNGTGVFTNSADTNLNDADKFFSDDSAYGVLKNTDGQLELKNVYTVTWNNWDGTELEKDENVFKDTTPTFDGDTPTKPADNQYRYTFSGWTPALAPVTADTIYTAQFTEKPKTLISGHSLTLDGDIGINFYIDPSVAGKTVADIDSLTYTLEWETQGIAKKPLTVLGKSVSKDEKSIIVTCEVCAAEMTCGVKASFSLGNKTENEVYSVRKYCDEGILAANAPYRNNQKLYNLANAMLDYGAKAQTVFEVKTGDLANKNLDYTMPEGTPDFDAAVYAANNANSNISEVQISGGSFKFATLVFLTKNTLRLYFENSGGLPTGSMTKWNDYYYMQKTDIPANELDTLQEFDVNGTTLTYSALDYAKGLASLGNDYTALACALYYYNQAANEYFG